jgi:hypothetical protein
MSLEIHFGAGWQRSEGANGLKGSRARLLHRSVPTREPQAIGSEAVEGGQFDPIGSALLFESRFET